jgi:hypothetical protein
MMHERSAAVQSAFRLLAGWAGAFACLAEKLRPEILRAVVKLRLLETPNRLHSALPGSGSRFTMSRPRDAPRARMSRPMASDESASRQCPRCCLA